MSHPEFSTEPFFYEGAAERRQGKRPHPSAAKPVADEDAWERPLKRVALGEAPSEPEALDPVLPNPEPAPKPTPTAEPARSRRRAAGLKTAWRNLNVGKPDLHAFKNAWVLTHGAAFLVGFFFCGAIALWTMSAPPTDSQPTLAATPQPLTEQPATLVEADALPEPPAATIEPEPVQPEPVVSAPENTASHSLWKPHRIQPGETIRNLSAKYDIQEREIFLRNGGRFVPRVGRVIMLPSRSFQTHTVKRGDSLHVIARKYQTDVASLQELNGLSSTSIKVGLPLRVM